MENTIENKKKCVRWSDDEIQYMLTCEAFSINGYERFHAMYPERSKKAYQTKLRRYIRKSSDRYVDNVVKAERIGFWGRLASFFKKLFKHG